MRYRHDSKELISKKEAFDLLKEFKLFAFRRNFLDLSVGVIIGGSLNKIISSLVDNILMPIISIIFPFESGYKKWSIILGDKEIPVGAFLGDVVTFVIISFLLFLFIKKVLFLIFEEKKESEKEVTLEQKTLLEIKDILKDLANKHS